MNTREEAKRLEENSTITDRFATKARLNLNDLLRRRSEEKKVEIVNISCTSKKSLMSAGFKNSLKGK